MNKVVNTLEDNKISFIVYEKENIILSRDFKKINSYKKNLQNGLKKIAIEERIKKIDSKIRTMNQKELDKILEMIEDAIS